VDDVEEKFHGLLGLDRRGRPGLDPLFELVNSDKQVRVSPGRLPEGPDQIHFLNLSGVLEPAGGSAERSIGTLRKCALSAQRQRLSSAGKIPGGKHSQPGFSVRRGARRTRRGSPSAASNLARSECSVIGSWCGSACKALLQ
jgi:hypothetical protein